MTDQERKERAMKLAWTQRLVDMPSLRQEIGRVIFGIKPVTALDQAVAEVARRL
jgi:hypothetical protein